MKRFIIAALLLTGVATFGNAQTVKFGHINSQELVALMPEMDSARLNLQAYQTDLEETMQGMEDEYNAKYTEYQRKQATWTPAVRETKEADIQNLVQRIQQFQQTAQQDMQQMQQRLFQPIFEKAQASIQKVAKSNGLIYVFESSSLLYMDNTQSLDLLPLAKADLGIPAEKVTPTQIPAPNAAK